MAFRLVHVLTNEEIFRSKDYTCGSPEIAGFIGIVHAFRYCQENKLSIPVYSDSWQDIWYVFKRRRDSFNKKYYGFTELIPIVNEAEEFLKNYGWTNEILKWDSDKRGQNPAKFKQAHSLGLMTTFDRQDYN